MRTKRLRSAAVSARFFALAFFFACREAFDLDAEVLDFFATVTRAWVALPAVFFLVLVVAAPDFALVFPECGAFEDCASRPGRETMTNSEIRRDRIIFVRIYPEKLLPSRDESFAASVLINS